MTDDDYAKVWMGQLAKQQGDGELARLRAELAACKEQLHLTNIDWFQAEAERDALLALLRSAVMQLPEHRRARFEDALKGDGDE